MAGRAKAFGVTIAWVFAFLTAGMALTEGLNLLAPDTESPWWLAREGAIHAAAFAAATWAIGRVLDHRAWGELGWRDGWVPRGFMRGLAWGAAMATFAVVLAVIASGARVHMWGLGATPPAGGSLLVGVLLAALAEELMFRGYPLRRLADLMGRRGAAITSGIVFGTAHLLNPEATVFGLVNIAFAGMWLSLAFFSPGGMPLAWGVHFGWNAALAELFHAPVSGYAFPGPGIHYSPGRYPWIDGGTFGPEGGLVGTIAIAAGVAILLATRRTQPAPAAA
jgi:membrane protease YdiL (CAAX protease family)